MTDHQKSHQTIENPTLTKTRLARLYEYTQLSYQQALDLQMQLVEQRLSGDNAEDAVILLEHPHTYTLGRAANTNNILLSDEYCRLLGIEIHQTDRGGDVTYHGPGQLIIYPIISLQSHSLSVGAYVRALEEVAIRTLSDFSITARHGDDARGVWVGPKKIAALGVRVRRWITMHGLALNVNTDLSHFRGINPCGVPGAEVTSMVEEGFDVRRQDEVREAIAAHFAKIFQCTLARVEDSDAGRPPRWIKARIVSEGRAMEVRRLIEEKKLHTVCSSAHCPNMGECWGNGTATFMINGDICTRSCRFCAVLTGRPLPIDEDEPRRVAEAAATMNLRHVVVTSVNRDELPDGGASQFVHVIEQLRAHLPKATIEVLIPDFKGNAQALEAVFNARPDVLNHNVETVPRLYPTVRPQANYQQSLNVLKSASERGLPAKSGIMLGLGERKSEVEQVLSDLHQHGCRIVTIGQYLRPSPKHHPVIRYVPLEEFMHYRQFGEKLGISRIESAPLVRSSYHAHESMSAL